MKPNIIVLSHGEMCEATIGSLKMIADSNDGMYSIPLHMEDLPENYFDKVKKTIEGFNGTPFIIITDIFGGTPYNTALRVLQFYDTYVISGLCLGMLLEAKFLRDTEISINDLAKRMAEVSHESCRVINREAFFNHIETLY